MPYSITINISRFSLVLLGFITLVACGGVEDAALPINEAPTASSVTITDDNAGEFVVGDTLTGNYVYADAENDAEGVSIYRWLRNGELIGGTTTPNYALVAADVDQSITFVVTPVAETGTVIGNPVSSDGIGANSVPVADAGADQTAVLGETVTLNGSASSDVDGDPLTYSWSFTSQPALSAAVLSDPAALNPTFVVDLSGNYVVQLIVNDGVLDSDADTVIISTSNSAPVADAGADQAAVFGASVNLNGSASSDVDGDPLTYRWSLRVPTGSGAALSDPTAVNPSFGIDVSGDYVAQLIVNDGTADSATDTVTISTNNSAPVANAGADQSVFVNDTVTLNGGGSSDADSDPLTFIWSLTVPTGSLAVLSDPTVVTPTFVVDLPGSYVAQLIVNDGTVNSTPDTVTISTTNSAPVANAGADQATVVGDMVYLNGSGSSDVDGNGLTFSWSFTSVPTGSGAVLSGPTTENPSFNIDVPGNYVVQLIVNDGTVDSAPDTVTISTSNSAPVADAGADQTPLVGETVTLNGSDSSDVDGNPLTYRWSLIVPSGSGAALSDTTAISPSFVVDLPGEYVAQLIVNDGTLDSAADTVSISTSNSAPVANAGPDQTAWFGTVFLDGSGSFDVDGNELTFSWLFTSVPTGSGAVLSGPTTENPSFNIDVPGNYVVQLIVNDGTLNSAPDSVAISP